MSLLRLALEEASDGKSFEEIEYVFYARLPEPVVPTKGYNHSEHQEQWELKVAKSPLNAGQGGIRIRKTVNKDVKNAVAEYVMTTKVRKVDGANDEVPILSTVDNFEQFRVLSDRGMIKDRFEYPIQGTDLKWEVDMFLKPDGTYHPWVKIDLEVKQRVSPLRSGELDLPPFPFEAEEWIVAQTGERSDSEEAKLRGIYETIFLAKNRYAQLSPVADSNGKDGSVLSGNLVARSAADKTVIEMGARPMYVSPGLGYISSEELHARANMAAPETVPIENGGHAYQATNPAQKGGLALSIGVHTNAPAVFDANNNNHF